MVDGSPESGRPYVMGTGSVPPSASWPLQLAQTDGVLGRRWVAYLIDLVAIFFFTVLLSILIGIVGLVTFGLGWSLFAVLPFTAVLYSAVTVGGRSQATPGMRMMGLRAVDAGSGGQVGMVTAAVHALLFYVAAGTFILWVVDLLVGFARPDRRLGHDLLAGVALIRAR